MFIVSALLLDDALKPVTPVATDQWRYQSINQSIF